MQPDLGAIVRAAGEHFLATQRVSTAQRKVLAAIAACRTPALGGERQQCVRCRFEHVLWHSCRNRHCPRCQAAARAEWLARRSEELLPVPYFHVVFTVPESLNIVARWAPRIFYEILFRAAGQTLLDIGRTKLGVQLGALCVLHTWGQTLTLHPHIHCVVPGGGFAEANSRWRSVRKRSFFLPVRVLSRRFRSLVCHGLREAHAAGRFLSARPVADRSALEALLRGATSTEWITYAKPPFAGPRAVLAYLAAYTHRIAISNRRIVACSDGSVTFLYRDYARGNRQKTMTLTTVEFLRRFLLHIVPSRFVRIRYYGFLANRARRCSLERARRDLGARRSIAEPRPPQAQTLCPKCGEGVMVVVAEAPPHRNEPPDTS